jgi:hypothetical protein
LPKTAPRSGPPQWWFFEVDLHDFAGGVAAHHHMEKHNLLRRRGNLEQRVVVDERNINSAGIASVGVNHRVTPRCRQGSIQPLEESVDDETVLASHTPSKSGPWPCSSPRSPRRAGRSCDHSDDQDHLVDLAHHRGAGQVSATVATIIKDLVSCVDRVVRATTVVDDAKDSSSKIIT